MLVGFLIIVFLVLLRRAARQERKRLTAVREADERREHLQRCGVCGGSYDPRVLDEVLFHVTDHRPRLATGAVGVKVK